MAPLKLGYWNIRGLAQPIRFALEIGGMPYEERRYNYGPPPTFDRSDWTNEKFNLGLDFPNIPYLIDGDLKIVQNLAVIRHVARKAGLMGKTDVEQARCDIVEQQLTDWRSSFVNLCYGPNFEENKKNYIKQLPETLKSFSDYLGNRKYFAGDNLTYADLLVYEMLFQNSAMSKESFQNFPKLVEFIKRIEDIPQMKAYMQSDKYIKWPFNGDMANFGSRLQQCPI